MAANDNVSRITPPELVELSDRLTGRANSILLRDQPNLADDLRLAARVIRKLIIEGIIRAPINLSR
jgi:hypothetical protein